MNVFEGASLAKNQTPGASLYSVPTNNASEVAALQAYPVVLIEDNDNTDANAGDIADNSFTLNWRCGTVEVNPTTPMNAIDFPSLSRIGVVEREIGNSLPSFLLFTSSPCHPPSIVNRRTASNSSSCTVGGRMMLMFFPMSSCSAKPYVSTNA